MPIIQKLYNKVRHPSRKMPIIAIVPAFDDAYFMPDFQQTVYLRRSYLATLANVGAMPLVVSPEFSLDYIMHNADGIILSGGENLNPAFYGQELLRNDHDHLEPDERYEFHCTLMQAAKAQRMPVLAICYGMHTMNVYYGGSMLQDIIMQRPGSPNHHHVTHDVLIQKPFLGLGADRRYPINSRHYQAIDRIADGFEVCAVSPDGIVEAFRRDNMYGIQWHPESDETGAHIYRSFVELCAPRIT